MDQWFRDSGIHCCKGSTHPPSRAAVDELNEVVRASEQLQKAEAAARLIKLPTGDGMALVFYTSPETPAQCAIEISRALKEIPVCNFGWESTAGQLVGCGRCKRAGQSRGGWPQPGATGDGLRRCRTHSCLETRRRRFRRIRAVASASARPWRLQSMISARPKTKEIGDYWC
jgi:hypothetical protein